MAVKTLNAEVDIVLNNKTPYAHEVRISKAVFLRISELLTEEDSKIGYVKAEVFAKGLGRYEVHYTQDGRFRGAYPCDFGAV